jgi:hypothetical protein
MEDAAQSLAERYRTLTPDTLRLVVWYGGDEHDVIHVRDDVVEMYSPGEFEEKVKQLVVEGISDPPIQESFRLFGSMGVAVRRFERAVVLHFPIDEFSGIAVTLDRDGAPSLDTLVDAGIDALDEVRPDQ